MVGVGAGGRGGGYFEGAISEILKGGWVPSRLNVSVLLRGVGLLYVPREGAHDAKYAHRERL